MKMPNLREYFREDMSEHLAIHLTSNLDWYRYEQLVSRLAEKIPKNAVVLDVGCGTGAQATMLSVLREDLTIYATDIDYHNSWQNLGKFKIKFSKGNAEFMNFRDGIFDAVISFGLLEHLKYPEKFLKEVRRVLKKNGLFFIFNLPNKYAFNEFLADCMGISPHPVRYTIPEITDMLTERGFKILNSKLEFFIPSLVNLVSKRLGTLFNHTYWFLDKADKLITMTPVKYFAEAITIEVRK